jgi:hypothetical protein
MKPAHIEKWFPWACVAALLIGVGLVVLRGSILLDDRRLAIEGAALLLTGIIVVSGALVTASRKQP